MTISFLSKICEKPIAKNHEAVECDNCKLWVHIKYNKMNKKTCNLFMEDDTLLGTVSSVQNLFFPSMTLTITNFIPLYRAKK